MDDLVANIIAVFILLFFFLVIVFSRWVIRFSSIGEGEHSGYISAVDQNGYIQKAKKIIVGIAKAVIIQISALPFLKK